MKLSQMARLAAFCLVAASTTLAQSPTVLSSHRGPIGAGIAQVGYCDCGYAGCGCEVAAPSCSSCAGPCSGGCGGMIGGCDESCDIGGCDIGGCDIGGCDIGGCDIGCGGIMDSFQCGGDPFAILGHCGSLKMGGWAQLGYFNESLILFNSRKNEYQLQQAWLYVENEVDTSCGFDTGWRIDYIYGTDGPDTQAFGIDNGHWDNRWDNGGDYGSAIPQAYFEAAYGDVSVKLGHFYTVIGFEVVQAPDNIFYSHAYTMYNSEPFTHTGALITYSMNEDVEVFGGYVLGWDSGFEDNGDAYLGGTSLTLTEDITLTYASTIGRFFDDPNGTTEQGYMQSIVADIAMTDKLRYVFQTDFLDTENNVGLTVRDTVGINQYLVHSINDCLSLAARFEWWHFEGDSRGYYGDQAAANFIASGDYDVFDLTLGVQAKPHANVLIRPEIRWDWVDGNLAQLQPNTGVDFVGVGQILEDNDDRQTTFAIDTIFLY